jgi:hypothetical protein
VVPSRKSPLLPLAALLLPGCFTAEKVGVEDLRGLDRTVVVQILKKSGEPVRGVVGPTDAGPGSLRFQPLRYGPGSWVVHFGGWPLVYTAGKHLRHEIEGETREIPLSEIREVRIERYSHGLTLLSLPLTFPVGLIDFLVHQIRFGFENVDARFDTFSRPPASSGDTGQIRLEPPR